METVKLLIPSDPQYVTTLRLVAASIARKMNFDIDVIEDIRVCVSEAVNYLFPINKEIEIIFDESEEKLKVIIKAGKTDSEGSDLHRMILESLMDEVDDFEGGLTLIKRR